MQPAATLRVLVDVDTRGATRNLGKFDAQLKKSAASAKTISKDYEALGRSMERIQKSAGSSSRSVKQSSSSFDKLNQNVSSAVSNYGQLDKSVGKSTGTINKHSKDVDRGGAAFGNFAKKVITANQGISLFSRSLALIKIPAFVAAVGYAAEGVAVLAGATAALVGALAPLGGLLASAGQAMVAFGQVQATIAISGLKNIGTAIGGIGTPIDKASDGFKQLGSEAQKFAIKLDKVQEGPLKKMQARTQKAMFPGLTRGLDAAMKNLPALSKVLVATGGSLGFLAEKAGKFAGSKAFGKDIQKIGLSNAQIIRRLGGTAIQLAKAFMDVVVVARPLTNWLTKLFDSWGRGLARAAEAGRKSGGMAQFFKQTRRVTADLVGIFKNVGVALWNIIKAGAPLGRAIIDKLREGSKELRQWTESTKGKNTIAQFFKDIKPTVWELGRLFVDIVKAFFQIQKASQGALAPLLKQIRTELLPILVEVVSSTAKAFGPKLVKLLTETAKLLGNLGATSGPLFIWTEAMTKVVQVLNWMIENVPGFNKVLTTLIGFKAVSTAMNMAGAVTGVKALGSALLGLRAAAIASEGAMLSLGTVGAFSPKLAENLAKMKTGLVNLGKRLIPSAALAGAESGAAFGAAFEVAAIGGLIAAGALIAAALYYSIFKSLQAGDIVDAGRKFATFFVIHTFGLVPALIYYIFRKQIGDVVMKGLSWIGDKLGKVWEPLKNAAKDVFNWVKNAVSNVVMAIVHYFNLKKSFRMAWHFLKTAAKDVFEWLRNAVKNIVGWVGDKFQKIGKFLRKPWRWLKNAASNVFDWLKGAVKTVVNWIGDRFRGRVGAALRKPWTILKNAAKDVFNWLKTAVKNIVGWISDRASSLGKALSKPFDVMKKAAKDAFDWVKDKFDWLNDKASKAGDIIDKITPGGGGGFLGFGGAKGGMVPDDLKPMYVQHFQRGGTVGGKDNVPAALQAGEFVVKKETVQKIGQGVLKAMNETGKIPTSAVEAGQADKALVKGVEKTAKEAADALVDGVGKGHKQLGDDTDKFRKGQVKDYETMGKDVETKTVGAFKRVAKGVASALGELKGKGADAFKGLGAGSGEFSKATKQIEEDSGRMAKAVTNDGDKMRKEFKNSTGKLRKAGTKDIDQLKKEGTKDVSRLRKSAVTDVDKLRKNVTKDFQQSRKKATQASEGMKKGVVKDTDSMVKGVGKGLNMLEKALNDALKSLGVKEVKFGAKETKGKGGKGGGKAHGGLVGAATGMDVPGIGAGDKVHMQAMVEPGEKVFVLNKNASSTLENLQNLNSTVPRMGRAPYGPVNDMPGLAKGGTVSGSLKFALGPYNIPPIQYDPAHAGGNSHVHISGSSPEWTQGVAKQIKPMGWTASEAPWAGGLTVQHSDPGHATGAAADFNTAADETRPEVSSLAKFLGSGKIGKMSGTGGGTWTDLARILLTGPEGALLDTGQGVLDKALDAANKYGAEHAGTGSGMTGSGEVEKMFAEVAKAISVNKTATLALGEAGFAESGMQDVAGGDSTSEGALQLLASTAAGMHIDPHDEKAVASAFFQRGFYGRGGANKLAQQGLAAHMVAQSVQGSAFSSGSNYLAQKGPAMGWMRRFNLQQGGLVRSLQGGGLMQPGVLGPDGEKVFPPGWQPGMSTATYTTLSNTGPDLIPPQGWYLGVGGAPIPGVPAYDVSSPTGISLGGPGLSSIYQLLGIKEPDYEGKDMGDPYKVPSPEYHWGRLDAADPDKKGIVKETQKDFLEKLKRYVLGKKHDAKIAESERLLPLVEGLKDSVPTDFIPSPALAPGGPIEQYTNALAVMEENASFAAEKPGALANLEMQVAIAEQNADLANSMQAEGGLPGSGLWGGQNETSWVRTILSRLGVQREGLIDGLLTGAGTSGLYKDKTEYGWTEQQRNVMTVLRNLLIDTYKKNVVTAPEVMGMNVGEWYDQIIKIQAQVREWLIKAHEAVTKMQKKLEKFIDKVKDQRKKHNDWIKHHKDEIKKLENLEKPTDGQKARLAKLKDENSRHEAAVKFLDGPLLTAGKKQLSSVESKKTEVEEGLGTLQGGWGPRWMKTERLPFKVGTFQGELGNSVTEKAQFYKDWQDAKDEQRVDLMDRLQEIQGTSTSLSKMNRIPFGLFGGQLHDTESTISGIKDDVRSTLEGVQGLGFTEAHMGLPLPMNFFGGQIHDTELRLAELLAPPDAGVDDNAAELLSLQQELTAQAQARANVAELQMPVFRQFAGAFAEGGRIPAGMWGIAGERGPEVIDGPASVTPVGGHLEVHVHFRDDRLKDLIDVEVREVQSETRSHARRMGAYR